MNGKRSITTRGLAAALLLAGAVLSQGLHAQVPVDEDGQPIAAYSEPTSASDAKAYDAGAAPLGDGELQELVGPVALYPDDLLAIVLPAATYPLEIVQAARFLEALEGDRGLEPDPDWDESVVALLNYPDVVRMMDEDIDWTWQLGEAVLAQQADVIAAVERFRDRAYAAGNLQSDDYQDVSYEDGVIEIVPVDDEIIYVPYYEPAEVVIRQPRRVYYYYPDPYPVYYYPYPAGYRFQTGYFWGVTTAFTIGWHNQYLRVYHPSYWGHPYYGRYYYGHYYRRPSITVYNRWYVNDHRQVARYRYRDGDYWRPRRQAGSRQRTEVLNSHYYREGSRRDDRIRREAVTRQDRHRRSNDGRMELGLRDRGRQEAVSRSTPRSTTATGRGPLGPTTDGTAGRRAAIAGSRSSAEDAGRRRTTATAAVGGNRGMAGGARTDLQRRAGEGAAPNRRGSSAPAAERAARSTRPSARTTPSRPSASGSVRREAPSQPSVNRSSPQKPARTGSDGRSGSRSESQAASRGSARGGETRRSSARRGRPND